MSKAEPMDGARRLAGYRRQTGRTGASARVYTCRQWRRYRHKEAARDPDFAPWLPGKGRPTPRQKPRRDG